MSKLSTIVIATGISALIACNAPPDPRRTNFELKNDHAYAKYDPKSGRLKKIDVDQNKNGRMETFSFWDGSKLELIQVDNDEDGKIDRWEHYGEGNKMTRVGSSSRDDQVEDTWAYPDDKGFLARVETDTDRDGIVDKKELFVPRPDGTGRVLSVVELEIDKSGAPSRRLHYRPDGSFAKSEVLR